MGGGHARPCSARIAALGRGGAPLVVGAHDGAAAGIRAPGCREIDRRPVIGVRRTIAADRARPHGEGADAVRWREATRLRVLVADGGDDHHPARREFVDRGLQGCATRALHDERDVEELRRGRVLGHPRDRQSPRPAHRVNEIGEAAAAVADDPNGEQLREWRDPRDPCAVVGRGEDRAGDVGSMPRGVARLGALGAVAP